MLCDKFRTKTTNSNAAPLEECGIEAYVPVNERESERDCVLEEKSVVALIKESKTKRPRRTFIGIAVAVMLGVIIIGISGCSGNDEYNETNSSVQNTDYDSSAPADAMDTENTNDTAGHVLINGVPISHVIGMTAEEIIEIFGTPETYNECESIEYNALASNEMIFNLSEANTVSDFEAGAENFTLDAQSLSQDFDTVVSILGETYENLGGGRYSYPVSWQRDGCEIIFEFPMIETDDWDMRVYVFQATSTDDSSTEEQILSSLLYQGESILSLLGNDSEEIRQSLGEPTDGTPVTGELLYGGTEFYVYDGIMFMFDEQGGVFNITIDADYAEKDGQKLSQNREGILNLLGTPTYEEDLPEDESGEGFGGYYVMEYSAYDGGFITDITIQMPDVTSKATSVVVSRYPETDSEDDYDVGDYPIETDGPVSIFDLIGTWTFADEGRTTLTLYSNGTCDGKIGRRFNPETGVIEAISPDTWVFLGYEQVIQIPITVSSMEWDMLGKYVYESYRTELLNFKVSMINGVLHLENTEDADTSLIEYVKVP